MNHARFSGPLGSFSLDRGGGSPAPKAAGPASMPPKPPANSSGSNAAILEMHTWSNAEVGGGVLTGEAEVEGGVLTKSEFLYSSKDTHKAPMYQVS